MIFSKKDEKYYKSIFKNVLARKTPYFHRLVHINNKQINCKIIRIKQLEQLSWYKDGYIELPQDISYFMFYKNKSIIKNIKLDDCEIILTQPWTNKIIHFYKKNDDIEQLPEYVNIWIFKKNYSSWLALKIDDIVFTR